MENRGGEVCGRAEVAELKFKKEQSRPAISVVTPTLSRPDEVAGLLDNLSRQEYLPAEVVLVDAGPPEDTRTRCWLEGQTARYPFKIVYIEAKGGTAVQRNVGIDAASGNLIALIDDDIRLAPDFFAQIVPVFQQDHERQIAAVAGYIVNQYLDPARSRRWRLYRRLRLFTTYEPGRFDFWTGYPINRYLHPPHDGLREVDCVGANCVVWRREVFEEGVRFSPFFTDYGVIEDAHMALQARKRGWRIIECGRARCVHKHAPGGRGSARSVAWKTAVNYRFLFVDIVRCRCLRQEIRFWTVQLVQLLIFLEHAIRKPSRENWSRVLGKVEGILDALAVRPSDNDPPS